MPEFLRSGGPVLWLILALGAAALVVFLERSLQLHRDRIDSTDFLQGIFNALRRGNDREALALCEETPGPVARLASIAIRRRSAPRERLLQEFRAVAEEFAAPAPVRGGGCEFPKMDAEGVGPARDLLHPVSSSPAVF